jgi:hypothetical protein
VFAEESKNIRHTSRDHTAVIPSRDFVIFVRHIQFLQLLSPSPRIRDRTKERSSSKDYPKKDYPISGSVLSSCNLSQYSKVDF